MSKLRIEGPVELRGEVSVRGAKNAALPILVAAAAGTEPIILDNVPTDLNDIGAELAALEHIGCRTNVSDGRVEVDPTNITTTSLPGEVAGRFRSSLLFLGLLAGRCGHARISLPGGCDLGDRKFDLHLEGLRRLGAEVCYEGDTIEVTADRLVGTDIDFYLPTTSGTETVLLAGCFAEGRTRIFNANTRPEIVDMAACLNAMGANISVRNRVVEIEGNRKLTGCRHRIIEGWDEALTYIIAAGMTHGEICVKDLSLKHICNDVAYLRQAGLDIFEWGGNVYVTAKGKELRSFDLFTAPYPGVNSDMQPLFAAFASQCKGESSVTDQRFTERFQYTTELQKLGMPIQAYGNCAVIQGPANLKGASVRALDLRCGAALILSALTAEGTTVIDNCYQIGRGYEYFVSRFRSLGAEIEELDS
ncbi:MAG: UDP-N-acetylglucosamine 1-carboxyvinyltransferase [Phycisphaerae bacterium]|nr:UDP-N-acetylglucosamine 1-carboxyvinyltransferase [Phycisphaerae bacterium]